MLQRKLTITEPIKETPTTQSYCLQTSNHFKTRWNIVQKINHFRTIVSRSHPKPLTKEENGNTKWFHPVGNVLHQGP